MIIIGILVALGAAVAFAALGAVTLLGGADATQRQLLPGFLPDRPGGMVRLLALLAVWVPVILIGVFCLLTVIQLVRVVFAAI